MRVIVALICMMVVASGCGPSEQEKFEATAKLLSAKYKNSKTGYIRVLISEGADVNARGPDGMTPLMYAARDSSTPEIVQLLLEKGAEVNARSTYGGTPLMLAAMRSSTPEIVQLLLEKGAEVNARNTRGGTPLMNAAWNTSGKSAEIKQLLIDAGAKE
jgi:ankyrin repeat protein